MLEKRLAGHMWYCSNALGAHHKCKLGTSVCNYLHTYLHMCAYVMVLLRLGHGWMGTECQGLEGLPCVWQSLFDPLCTFCKSLPTLQGGRPPFLL